MNWITRNYFYINSIFNYHLISYLSLNKKWFYFNNILNNNPNIYKHQYTIIGYCLKTYLKEILRKRNISIQFIIPDSKTSELEIQQNSRISIKYTFNDSLNLSNKEGA